MAIQQFFAFIRAKGEPDSAWRDMEADQCWTTGDGGFGLVCRANKKIRRFLSQEARAGREVELLLRTPRRDMVKAMFVGNYKNQGQNRAETPVARRYDFRPVEWPPAERFVTVKMITD